MCLLHRLPTTMLQHGLFRRGADAASCQVVNHVVLWLLVWFPFVLSGQARIVLSGGGSLGTLAGSGNDGATHTGSAPPVALGHPRGVLVDASSILYLADSRNHQVYRIAPSGEIAVVAGTGKEGFSGDGGPATSADLSHPSGLALRMDGTLLIADTGNHRIRSVTPDGVISTIAGIARPGESGDGGPAAQAALRRPGGVMVDGAGGVLIADTGNHRIRRIDASGIIRPLAGTGSEGDGGDGGPAVSATFRSPAAMAVLPGGRILVADASARRIRSLELDGTVESYSSQTPLRRPEALGVSADGDLLIADAALQQVFQVAGLEATNIAGNGTQGTASAGPAWLSSLNSPSGTATDVDGNIVISDRRNHQVQRVALPALAFGSVPAGQQSSPQELVMQNAGRSALQVTSLALPPGFMKDAGGTCPALPFQLDEQQQCSITLVFAPTAQGPAFGFVSVATDLLPIAAARLSGLATAPSSLTQSQTTLSVPGSIGYTGAPLRLSASVAGSLKIAPGGNVSFLDGGTVLATIALSAGRAGFSTSALLAGSHTLHASYSGDSVYAASDSAASTIAVVAAPDFTLSSAAASFSGKTATSVTIPLTVMPLNGTLNHAITMTMSGLPPGFTVAFSPPVFTLAGNPATSTMTITVPATVAALPGVRWPLLAGALFALPVACLRRRATVILVLSIVSAATVAGCGGGFRTVSTAGASSTTFKYNATITATTTGVVGDTLTHSIPIELVITP